jgi:hypothetical protein
MTVAQLREALKDTPDDLPAYIYGMRPGSFAPQFDIRYAGMRINTVNVPPGTTTEAFGLTIGELLNGDALGGY